MKHFESATLICNKTAVAVKRGKQETRKRQGKERQEQKERKKESGLKLGTRKNGIPDYKR
jgi:ribosome assembly protein YihI (activator of Der GTPase)